jgi:hypothetical protein
MYQYTNFEWDSNRNIAPTNSSTKKELKSNITTIVMVTLTTPPQPFHLVFI